MAHKYANGKIYKITSQFTHKIYIGSTTKTLVERLANHKGRINSKHYVSSREIIKLGDATIHLLEECPCDDNEALRYREQHFMDMYKDLVVNRSRAIRVKEVYVLLKALYDVEYKCKNKERIAAKHGEVLFCDCGETYTHNNKQRHLRTKKHINLMIEFDTTYEYI